jgi:hypothetical protein
MATIRSDGFHPSTPYRTKGAGAFHSSMRRGLDIVLSMTMLAFVGFLLVIALNARSGERAAHLWARYLGVHQENACPTAFGNAFWFSCASEVRRLKATD